MAMPEAPVNKNDSPVTWEYDVRAAGEILAMQSEAKPRYMKIRPDKSFRFCVAPLYAGHHPAARYAVNDVRHGDCQMAPLRFKASAIARAMAFTTGTATEFPNCL